MKRARVWLPAAMAAVLVASACTTPGPSGPTASPTPTPVPSPTFTCTATPAAQCTAEKAAEEKKQAADYAAAEKAYRAFTAERNRLSVAGGTKQATGAMKASAAGPYLSDILGFLIKEKQDDVRASGNLKIAEVGPLPGLSRTDSPSGEIALSYCEDGRSIQVLDSKKRVVGHGSLGAGKLFARQIDGAWKIYDWSGKAVNSCSEAP